MQRHAFFVLAIVLISAVSGSLACGSQTYADLRQACNTSMYVYVPVEYFVHFADDS